MAALEKALGTQMEFFAITIIVGDKKKKDISFVKGVRHINGKALHVTADYPKKTMYTKQLL